MLGEYWPLGISAWTLSLMLLISNDKTSLIRANKTISSHTLSICIIPMYSDSQSITNPHNIWFQLFVINSYQFQTCHQFILQLWKNSNPANDTISGKAICHRNLYHGTHFKTMRNVNCCHLSTLKTWITLIEKRKKTVVWSVSISVKSKRVKIKWCDHQGNIYLICHQVLSFITK